MLGVLLVSWIHLGLNSVQAQDRLLVLCEGAQDFYSGASIEAPSVGYVSLPSLAPEFITLHTFTGHAFATDMVLSDDGNTLFVSAEDTVYRMNAWTGEVLAEQAFEGARKLALAGDRLYVTRGDVDPMTWASVDFDTYLVALDANSLAWDAEWAANGTAGPAYSTEGLVLHEGLLYVAINNAFAFGEEVGKLGRLDLTTGTYDEVELGPEGLNPVHIFSATDGGVVTVNAQQYDGTSLSRWDSDGVQTVPIAEVTAGCGAAAWHEEGVLFQVYGEGDFRKADGLTLAEDDGWAGNGGAVYCMLPLYGEQVALGTTDFSTNGAIELWHFEDGLLWTVQTGIAPGAMLWQSNVQGVPESEGAPVVLEVYDMMGRPVKDLEIVPGKLSVIRWSDGAVTKEWRGQD